VKIEATTEQLFVKTSIVPRPSAKESLFEKVNSQKEPTVISLQQESPIWRYAAAAVAFLILRLQDY